ncbi:PTS system N-acetylglucosamine-specific IIC component [Breznakia sp. PF5-3]|uniref:PTS transporter subunit EIIC n=1 Tax=unclassified Breznakia TaxID=2623764 RepID=UPI0024075231|nr:MULTISPECIES: PTS transporter subunit EIIC [unclassified Breznakia]MDF9824019.1 PTS system N-acetylglucosamine-specific IIC component [Breznakia sp. PM6-1]MDF9834818.1 PTS system N-acetylglucosamine-specific IIC component [Breznakia sp. PF5-3]MDF9838137.1 PTS system N-acetylglucosamine-specific IIC component [Breznakia sp. PFB2-8]MDF9860123.1 PTS system N-acetylglucosamine-specific IIC component [Breznakia sp. PH5-24]
MTLQKIGKSLLLPIAIFPIAAILTGLGYSFEQIDNSTIYFFAIILKTTGNALLSFMPMTFAVGVAYGLSDDQSGFSAFNGLLTFLIITSLLGSDSVASYQSETSGAIPIAFEKIDNQFIGILSGVIASGIYNRFNKKTFQQVNKYLVILLITILITIIVAIILYFLWPFIYEGLISFGALVSGLGPLGAGIYAFFNRLLIPIGMHHALNSVFWFDVIGINDIGNFWASTGTLGVTGMYQAGFFPIMMFGLPGVAFAMLKTAYPQNREKIKSFLLSAAFASFFTGVTEPLEFAFMFIAPPLYLLHAIITGICVFIAAQFQWIAGFSFSAGFIDFILSFNMPFSKTPIMLVVLGIFIFFLYYFTFTYVIKKFNMHTLGREVSEDTQFLSTNLTKEEALQIASILIRDCGTLDNITFMDCCITRLRFRLLDVDKFSFDEIKKTGALEYLKLGNEIQVVYGPHASYIMDVIEEMQSQNKS